MPTMWRTCRGTLYQLFERLAGPDTERLLVQLKAAPDVPVLPHNVKPDVLEATRRALARAGYNLTDFDTN